MSRFTAIVFALAVALTLGGCSDGLQPENLVKGQDACALCRMPVSDIHFAAQITAPGMGWPVAESRTITRICLSWA